MKRFIIFAALAATMLLAACGSKSTTTGGATQNTLSMGQSTFDGTTTFTIKVGQAIVFNDPTSGGNTHILLTGMNGTYTAEPGAPDDLNNKDGKTFSAGDKVTYTFATAGTYHITCSIHSGMNATVTVNP